MRRTSFALIFSLLALLAVPALAAGPDSALSVPSADVPVATALTSANLSLNELLADPVATAVGTSAWGCPYGAPTCTTNAQCDAYCGAPGFGQCEFAHWSGCCVCLG